MSNNPTLRLPIGHGVQDHRVSVAPSALERVEPESIIGGHGHSCKPWCEEAATRYANGDTLLMLATSLRSVAATIALSLRAHGVVIRRRGTRPGQSRRHAEILRLFRDEGVLAAEIGRRVNMSRERVRQILVANGIAWPTQPHGRHACTEACRVVQAADQPVAIPPLAMATGIIVNQLRRAAKIHEVKTRREKLGHVCDQRCATLLAGLKAGVSVAHAAHAAGFPTVAQVYTNFKVYHPDWPWTKTEHRRARHHCDPRCELFRAALERRPSVSAACRASGVSRNKADDTLRVHHPDWAWPARRAERVPVIL